MKFIDEGDGLSCVDDGDDCYLGWIEKQDDGFFWFKPPAYSFNPVCLGCKDMKAIAEKLSELNIG